MKRLFFIFAVIIVIITTPNLQSEDMGKNIISVQPLGLLFYRTNIEYERQLFSLGKTNLNNNSSSEMFMSLAVRWNLTNPFKFFRNDPSQDFMGPGFSIRYSAVNKSMPVGGYFGLDFDNMTSPKSKDSVGNWIDKKNSVSWISLEPAVRTFGPGIIFGFSSPIYYRFEGDGDDIGVWTFMWSFAVYLGYQF